jgi:hypothetical protein
VSEASEVTYEAIGRRLHRAAGGVVALAGMFFMWRAIA